jgi:hypothetical protein
MTSSANNPKPTDAEKYSTTIVESRPDMWTAKISRTGLGKSGAAETVSGLINVGSISHLIGLLPPSEKK